MDIVITPMVTDSTAAAAQTRRLAGGEGVAVAVAEAGVEEPDGAEAVAGRMTHRITIDVAPVNDLPILTLPAVVTHNHSHPDFTTHTTTVVTSVTYEDTAVEIRGVKIFDIDHASDDQGTQILFSYTFICMIHNSCTVFSFCSPHVSSSSPSIFHPSFQPPSSWRYTS